MSHYTAIKTKYKNLELLKKCVNKLSYSYTEHKKTIELYSIPQVNIMSSLYKETSNNYLSFAIKNKSKSYSIITDFHSWKQKEILSQFLQKLEINYGYSEIISQALELGFTRSRKILNKHQTNKFIFQRCIEVK